MAEIYRATDDSLGRAVAVKVLAERYASDDALALRFTREALAAARLSGQPNTVTIFDVGEWNERPFIVMEYLPAGSLADRLARDGAQPPERVLPWLEQAAAALDAAHRNGIVHRDVKPANLLLDRDGNVHVADFGIASAAGFDALTATGTILGTAGYLSPEQAQGEAATAASDRYALAVTTFELLTGERPFRSESVTAEAGAHVNAPVPSASARRTDLPRHVDRVFERALAKDPEARYATCGDFVAELRDAIEQGTAATTVLRAPPANRRRLPVPLALAAAVAAGAAGAGAALLLAGGGDRVRTVVERVTQPAVTVQQTVTQATTVEVTTTVEDQGTTAASPPPGSADGHALNDEGYARMQNGDYAGALPLLEQAVENLRGTGPADPYEGYANYNLGFTLLRLGRCDDALVSLEQAERLEPGHKDVLKALKEARKCLQRSQRGNEGG